jgi:O-antigen ligase
VAKIQWLTGDLGGDFPGPPLIRWASVFFSLCVVSLPVSVAASQTFLSLAGACYALDLLQRPRLPHFPPVKLPLALFCFFTVLSIAWAENPAVGWIVVRKLVLFLIILFTVNLIPSYRHLVRLYQAMFVGSAIAGLVAAGQFVVQYRTVRAEHPAQLYSYLTITRIHGFMGHWMNFGGQQMLIFSALAAYVLFSARSAAAGRQSGNRWRAAGWWLILGIIALSIVLNFTRGVWLGCSVAALYLVARWRPRMLWALPVAALGAYLASPSLVRERVQSLFHPSRDASISIRLEMWHAGLEMIWRHPLVGVGPDNINEVYTLYLPPRASPEVGWHEHLHDNFLQLAAERGLPCLAAWLWFMGALGWHFLGIRKRLKRAGSSTWVADAGFAGWLAFLIEGFFEFNFGTTPVLTVFLFVISAPFAAERLVTGAEDATLKAA